jgi:hypothetical protein
MSAGSDAGSRARSDVFAKVAVHLYAMGFRNPEPASNPRHTNCSCPWTGARIGTFLNGTGRGGMTSQSRLKLALGLVAVVVLLSTTRSAEAQFWNWSEAPCDRSWRDGRVGRTPARACALSVTASPYHAAYPMLLLSTEWRVARKVGAASDLGLGGYKGGTVGQVGLRIPFYPAGTFDAGLQLGPFVRMTSFHLPDRRATSPPAMEDSRQAFAPLFNDVEFARANGQNAIYAGILLGGKFTVGAHRAEFTWLRGFTFQGGVMFGYHHLLGTSRFGPDPAATRTGDGALSQIYLELGYSF